ncbi:hypothetical protein M8818_005121 [Zalaria obscura]|uniref:Uncharacterized protein n=1 Tax=Zalaria obscura TaxID=2024903 RepID=A0ACC3SAD3_9PEZI
MATQPPWATVGICRCCMKEKTGKCGKDDVNAAPKQNAATNQNAGVRVEEKDRPLDGVVPGVCENEQGYEE